MKNLVVVAVSLFQGEGAKPDSNGFDPVYLTPIAGMSPNRNVIAGTVAQNSGLEIGKSYLCKWTKLEDDPEYGPQYGWTKVSEISNPLDIINAEKELGAGKIFDVESKASTSDSNNTTASASNSNKKEAADPQKG